MADSIKPVGLFPEPPPVTPVKESIARQAPHVPVIAPPPPMELKRRDSSKPRLPIPETLASILDDTTDMQATLAKNNTDATQAMLKRLEDLEQAKMKKLGERAEKVRDSNTWGFYKQVAYCLTSAMSIIIGGALCATGQVPLALLGSALIGSGVTSIAAMILERNGVSREITGALAMASAGLGLVGSIGGILFNPGGTVQLILTIVNAAIAIGTGVTQYNINQDQAAIQDIEKEQSKIQFALRELGLDVEQQTTDMINEVKRIDASRGIHGAARTLTNELEAITANTLAAAAG